MCTEVLKHGTYEDVEGKMAV